MSVRKNYQERVSDPEQDRAERWEIRCVASDYTVYLFTSIIIRRPRVLPCSLYLILSSNESSFVLTHRGAGFLGSHALSQKTYHKSILPHLSTCLHQQSFPSVLPVRPLAPPFSTTPYIKTLITHTSTWLRHLPQCRITLPIRVILNSFSYSSKFSGHGNKDLSTNKIIWFSTI